MTDTVPNVWSRPTGLPQHANDAGVRVVEVDVDTTAYDQGHVPGAAGWNWTTELCDTLVRDIVPTNKLEELLGKTGIDNQTTIVLYGDNNNWFAAWAFWQLKIYGHEDVRIMDGGRKKWLAEGRELSTDKPPFPAKTYKASAADLSLRAFLPEVQKAVQAKSARARRRAQPAGVHRRDPRASRTAGNLPARRPHSRREEHSVGEGVQRRRHVQERGGAEGAVRRAGRDGRQAGDRVLPHRRAIEPHLVRAEVPARVREREELRRLLDRVGQSGRRGGREAVTRARQLESADLKT